ncbi:MAG TPA: CPBP family intramembrane glutamic endopeptidase [Candidatus Acidoferrales bacterium]|nr:CPBP family intramembrane glutamic endopeptidase [Candidatus Acidoferrales bacterium]
MDESAQGSEPGAPRLEVAPGGGGAPQTPDGDPHERGFSPAEIQRGLLVWLAIVSAGGLVFLLLGRAEGALLLAVSGAFALAQATDSAAAVEGYRVWVRERLPRDSAHGVLFRLLVRSLVPMAGALFYALLAIYANTAADLPRRGFAIGWCVAAVLASLALAWRPCADAVMRAFFRGTPGRTRRLTARLVVMALLLPVPARILFPSMLSAVQQSGTSLVDVSTLLSQMTGEIALALAGVGLFVRRDWSGARARLGLTALRPRDALFVAGGVLAAMALNSGADWLERHAFPGLYRSDTDITNTIAAHLPLWTSLLLGASAGVGEELAVRGALQPRLGIALSALVFACGHVQYSWFGMASVGLLGVLLGVIRARSNTTTAIVVHAVYDVFAALTAGH